MTPNFNHCRTLLALGWSLLMSACAGTPVAGNGWIDVGNGEPVVVMQAGFGEGKAVWQPLIAELARDHRVFAYDRPGTAGQPAGDGARDPCSIAEEQRTRLREASLKPPYLLVGHSLGGLYQYVYAKRYPDEVAGVVLLDPTHPRNWETLERTQPGAALLIKSMKHVAWNRAQKREFEQQTDCLDSLSMDRPLTQPGALLISGRPDEISSAEFEQARLEMAQDWLRLTGIDQIERVWESGHHIQSERPAMVAAAVRRVLLHTSLAADPAEPSEQTLAFGIWPPLRFVAGVTTLDEVVQAWGKASETRQDGDTTIAIYRDALPKLPLAVSFIPVVGDIADALSAADSLRERHEAIVRFDAHGRVFRWTLRALP